MSKTIKQLADQLGVSKTAVRKYMSEDFRGKYTAIDHKGVISISSEGCKLVAAFLERSDKLTENTAKQFAETSENTENIVIPKSVWDTIQEQLKQKDEQLRIKDQQLADLTATVKAQAQGINADRHNELAGTLQHQLQAPKKEKKHWWQKK